MTIVHSLSNAWHRVFRAHDDLPPELPPRARAFIKSRSRGLDRYTDAELDEMTLRGAQQPGFLEGLAEAKALEEQQKEALRRGELPDSGYDYRPGSH